MHQRTPCGFLRLDLGEDSVRAVNRAHPFDQLEVFYGALAKQHSGGGLDILRSVKWKLHAKDGMRTRFMYLL
jgi:hypothetical protein